jgi:hypothetical protein
MEVHTMLIEGILIINLSCHLYEFFIHSKYENEHYQFNDKSISRNSMNTLRKHCSNLTITLRSVSFRAYFSTLFLDVSQILS